MSLPPMVDLLHCYELVCSELQLQSPLFAILGIQLIPKELESQREDETDLALLNLQKLGVRSHPSDTEIRILLCVV